MGSGNVLVRGWQLESVHEDFDTGICHHCIEASKEQENEDYIAKAEVFEKWRKRLYMMMLPVGIVTLVLAVGLLFVRPDMPFNVYIGSISAICIIVPLVFPMFAPKFNTTNEALEKKLHSDCIETFRAALSERIGEDVLPVIMHPEPAMPAPSNIHLQMHFIVPYSALSTYERSKKKTGWSRIDYFHRNGDGMEGKYDRGLQSENLQNFELDHWGEFLSRPPSAFESVIGFFEEQVAKA